MGFKQVFYALREVFPQIDLRILKAVASQYSSDVDAAVEFVLSDVLPAVSEPMDAHYTLQDISYDDNDHTNSCTSGGFPEKNPCPSYGRLLYDKSFQEYSNFEYKVVTNETTIIPQVEYKVNMLPFCDRGPSDCTVKYKTKMSSKLPKGEGTQDFSEQDDLGNLCINSYPTEGGHASANSLCPSNDHRVSELRENYEFHVLLEKEMHPKLSEAESICRISKSENHYKWGFCSNNIIQRMDALPSAPNIQQLSKSEDSYDLQVLFKKEMPLRHSTAASSHDISKSKDNYDFQILLEDNGNGGNELDLLTTKTTLEPHNSEDNLHGKPCTTTQLVKSLIHDEYQELSCKLDNQCRLSELLASLNVVDNSLQTFEGKGNLHTVDKGEKHDLTNAQTFIDICNSNEDSNLSELSSSTRNISLFEDSEYGVRGELERSIMCSNNPNKHSIIPLVVHDTDKYEEYLDLTTQSYGTSKINELIANVTNSKEALSSLYESTRKKMNEVEVLEENLRKAKQEAAEAHQSFITIVENYNKLIENLRESNDKKAGIVREEKLLLDTLAQDLQSRLYKLSADRDGMLTIIEEVKSELDARLATSIEAENAARENICQKEKLAQCMREEKEAAMGSIMEESMNLQMEAEENILLRNFLTDRGHIIDMLQEEISSIHEKVVALKKRTHRKKLHSALVTTSSSATFLGMHECKTLSPDSHRQLQNQDNSGVLTQEKMVGSPGKEHEGLSDGEWEMLEITQDEWEMLETTQA